MEVMTGETRIKRFLLIYCDHCQTYSRSVVHMEKHLIDNELATGNLDMTWVGLPWGTYSQGQAVDEADSLICTAVQVAVPRATSEPDST